MDAIRKKLAGIWCLSSRARMASVAPRSGPSSKLRLMSPGGGGVAMSDSNRQLCRSASAGWFICSDRLRTRAARMSTPWPRCGCSGALAAAAGAEAAAGATGWDAA